MEIREEFFSGFCRTRNDSHTVCCEYSVEQGVSYLENMDCAHKKCVHHSACEIYKEAHEIGQER